MRSLAILAVLGTLATAYVPAASAGWPSCVPTSGNLEETYLCVDPNDTFCPVYNIGGGQPGRRCVVRPLAELEPEWPWCIPTSGGMDYHSYFCMNLDDRSCPVYTISHTDYTGIQKKCYGKLPRF
jgi:hypothetical protein